MNTLDDLRSSLDSYADRDDDRGADAVWAAASEDTGPSPLVPSSSTRRPIAVALAAACFLVIAALAIVAIERGDEVGVVTTPTRGPSTSAATLAPIEVLGGNVADVHVAFGRVWITTVSNSSESDTRLRAFEIGSGLQVVDIQITGSGGGLESTEGALWVRTSLGWGSIPDAVDGERAYEVLSQIDPSTGVIERETPLRLGGPTATSGRRIAVANQFTLTIVDEDAGVVATTPIADAIGHANVHSTDTGPEPAGLAALAYGPDALVGLYLAGYPDEPSTGPTGQLVEMDPDTARHRSTRTLDASVPFSPHVAVTGDTTWLVHDDALVPTDRQGTDRIGLDRQYPIDPGRPVVAVDRFGDRVVARTATHVVVAERTGGSVDRTLEPSASAATVFLDGTPWIAQWNGPPASGPTVVTFVALETTRVPGATLPPTTEPPPPSTVVGNGAPTLMVMEDDPLLDGETYSVVGAGLPPGDAFLRVCLDQPVAVGGDCWVPAALPDSMVTVADDGQLMVAWTAQRSVYDDRWHDCAVEGCSLRLLAANEAGGVDLDRALAEAPLRFAGDDAPVRPSLVVEPVGPLTLGTFATITGANFLPGTKGIALGTCRAGDRQQSSCRYVGASLDLVVDASGRFTTSLTFGLSVPNLDGRGTDCSPGTCSFSIFPDEGSVEPYATVVIDVAG